MKSIVCGAGVVGSSIAEKLSSELKNIDKNIESISVAKPGFINIKLKSLFWSNFIKEIKRKLKCLLLKQ